MFFFVLCVLEPQAAVREHLISNLGVNAEELDPPDRRCQHRMDRMEDDSEEDQQKDEDQQVIFGSVSMKGGLTIWCCVLMGVLICCCCLFCRAGGPGGGGVHRVRGWVASSYIRISVLRVVCLYLFRIESSA